MQAGDVMTLGAATVHPDATVLEAAQLMLRNRISGLPVVETDGQLVGIVTEGDLIRRVELGTERHRARWLEFLTDPGLRADEYTRAHGRTVGEVMTRAPETIARETPLREVADLMERRGFKRLPVVRDGKIIGIVSRANLLAALARRLEALPEPIQDDLSIRSRIVEEVDRGGWAAIDAIDVSVRGGKVELTGTVGDDRVRDAAQVVAENVAGVGQVANRIEVIPIVFPWA
ncbi:CBS domain-containing protein [Chelatococcus reniformis]|uniref:CBS domain-containing protein n=1 Tax=Chelatococcus reniformis TaxID=1494448 RepID=A0A916X7W4_9HYPH|nr:CBS domain-containing protein [Chelatococcus reniformis]GGC52673.1 hypothetical protein GCM10010994_09690 [Chelatococcus reniformis]